MLSKGGEDDDAELDSKKCFEDEEKFLVWKSKDILFSSIEGPHAQQLSSLFNVKG